ncbi:phosphatidylserine/phosphatidylglycerophosphate/cardiolipin synthase family protein [Rodentibacter caecimuris]|uniref:phosphatidylserine/phosphatidylglycerophosphate/ cardiolipin synthase family protein n=1 Tax=Rodentibacter caecimuris TaxID=1796644 RepID=UPI0013A09DB2|nr:MULTISPECIES: phosphatidylserine/phosphatidylglycerophosphate/cardiolipin synthase family protein [Pasteurellaceae]MCR1837983.1 phosphatidylserine/phosphatidylglycerophosphate/cardiolipin synthase family protein [Pasteurella caecimuris]MCU0107431.1 phosphatidylserine/phosphatidylglycerophosphate/cardiolipin synthase family protein [Pasteurella caecimuris]MCX2962436.1 phosphatidylserine/phosphatidylglycerophosphate/cardiolipin synthase family protein [Rodentibacter heylii]QIA77610.1 phosphati
MTEEIKKPIQIPASKYMPRAKVGLSWFLSDRDKQELQATMSDAHSQPVPATFKALINGEEAFGAIYEKIENAEHSIDIAIWGFQPSMYFKRDGKSLRIGDLLVKKALEGVKVRLLVWSMWGDVQIFKEDAANLGNRHIIGYGRAAKEILQEQMDYDAYWYEAIEGKFHLRFDSLRHSPDSADEAIQNVIDKLEEKDKERFPYLWQISQDKARLTKIQYKNRRVALFNDINNGKFADKNLPWRAELILAGSSTHHQKMVLIDYERPEQAVGFVMEHNMLDNYWDHSTHIYGDLKAANQGKNVNIPLQDVSSIVTGQVLWDLNYNFCQSWDRNELFDNRGYYNSSENLTALRKDIQRTSFKPNPTIGEGGMKLYAQIVRTYDQPRVKDIMKVYLKNIQQTTSYIYTENQYFRWPVLVEEFLSHWKTMRKGRTGPIHWFTVTNSSDSGIGAGTLTTNNMLKLLGRQDVMPNVAKKVRVGELEAERAKLALSNSNVRGTLGIPAPLDKATAERVKALDEEIAKHKRAVQEAEDKMKKHEEIPEPEEDRQFTQKLGYELDDTPGIKAHICTLVADNAWQEVYVHSKVTIIDDVFTVISSANLNTRSMEKDTELGIILEAGEVACDLRKRLWGLHTKQNAAANPEGMYNYNVAEDVFDVWGKLIRNNGLAKINGDVKPLYPLRQFFRPNPKVSRAD